MRRSVAIDEAQEEGKKYKVLEKTCVFREFFEFHGFIFFLSRFQFE